MIQSKSRNLPMPLAKRWTWNPLQSDAW